MEEAYAHDVEEVSCSKPITSSNIMLEAWRLCMVRQSHPTLLLLQVLSFFEVSLEHGLSTDQVIKVRQQSSSGNRMLC